MYEIIFSKEAKEQLKKLDQNIQERILQGIEKLRIKPERCLKKLVGDPGFRLRVGDYRVIVDINRNLVQVLVISVGHRKNIYKK
ncbi:MAG: Addiction module toxin, RelE/StbE family [archaeon GW2011_AR13]|nr:MAG: Addiction module toxin, RelE/StbE family [archaeon GW2011_AR13]HIG94439.1 type II toxin-antitoxin system RelE/ParE family toxin [Nanoarchaeota archaeon]HIH62949.1 type II toxin-antitoxin system RelE/ParE family toxin [Nanoarchaeota archaeon]HIJ10354.1 type II toxin-antitoxin system RelE/ParE family toxin [Nanoarchaeota archaeon]